MKTYKGWELIKAINSKKIKEGAKFKSVEKQYKYIYKKGALWELYSDGDSGFEIGNSVIIANDFELIEEQQYIDIQDIEELKPNTVFDTKETIRNHYNKINELVQAVKQLDKREER